MSEPETHHGVVVAPATASTAPVDVAAFVTRMTNRWQTTLQNTVRPELQQVWAKLCSTLNDKIEKYGTVAGRKWSAFPGEMGVAKTEGLKLYCSMLVGNNGDTSSRNCGDTSSRNSSDTAVDSTAPNC